MMYQSKDLLRGRIKYCINYCSLGGCFQWEICFFLSRTTVTTNGSETSQNIIIDGQVTNSFEENHDFENVVCTEVQCIHHEYLFVTRLMLNSAW